MFVLLCWHRVDELLRCCRVALLFSCVGAGTVEVGIVVVVVDIVVLGCCVAGLLGCCGVALCVVVSLWCCAVVVRVFVFIWCGVVALLSVLLRCWVVGRLDCCCVCVIVCRCVVVLEDCFGVCV